jgi:hypothetical protein
MIFTNETAVAIGKDVDSQQALESQDVVEFD